MDGCPRSSLGAGLDAQVRSETEQGGWAKQRLIPHNLIDFCHQSGVGTVLVYEKLLRASWQGKRATYPWGRPKPRPSFVILAGIRTAEICFLREENTLFVWALPFSSTKPQFLLSLSAGFTCFHLSVGNFLHMNNNGIIDTVIFLRRPCSRFASQAEALASNHLSNKWYL